MIKEVSLYSGSVRKLVMYGSFCDWLCVNVMFKESIRIKTITVIISRYI